MQRPDDPARHPDYRFTLANERTLLAWLRTGLALVAGGVAVATYAPDLGARWGSAVVALAQAVPRTGAYVATATPPATSASPVRSQASRVRSLASVNR